ncbi:MAG: Uma2 family endonuclease [Hyphomicrobiaceae bacterium]
MANTRKPPPSMTVADFLAWPGDGTGRKLQLVDGEVRAMSPGSTAHGRIQSTLARLIGNALLARASPCDVIAEPGVATRVRAGINVRVPDVAVTCTPDTPGEQLLPDPVLLIEILSPTSTADTWKNVWSCCTIPSVREIAIVHSTRVLAELLGRGSDGHWPEETERIGPGGTLVLQSIQFSCPLTDV